MSPPPVREDWNRMPGVASSSGVALTAATASGADGSADSGESGLSSPLHAATAKARASTAVLSSGDCGRRTNMVSSWDLVPSGFATAGDLGAIGYVG